MRGSSLGGRGAWTPSSTTALRSLATSKSSTVHGFENALVARVLPRLVPRKLMAAIVGRATGLPAQRGADAVAG